MDDIVPSARVVPFDEVTTHLPADTPKVTPDEREDAIRYRREGFINLYGE